MANEVLEIREDETNNIVSYLNNSSNNVSSSISGLSSFSNFTSVGLFSSGLDMIKQQLSSIGESISSASSSVDSCYTNFSQVEDHLSSLADQIQVPMNFVKNDISQLVEMKSGTLKKEDGKAINQDNETEEQQLDFENSIKYNEKMSRFVKVYEELHGEVDIKGSTIKLENIKKDVSEKINYVLDESNIVKKSLDKLESKNSDTLNNLDFSVDLAKINLDKLKNVDLDEIKFDDKYDMKNIRMAKPSDDNSRK